MDLFFLTSQLITSYNALHKLISQAFFLSFLFFFSFERDFVSCLFLSLLFLLLLLNSFSQIHSSAHKYTLGVKLTLITHGYYIPICSCANIVCQLNNSFSSHRFTTDLFIGNNYIPSHPQFFQIKQAVFILGPLFFKRS